MVQDVATVEDEGRLHHGGVELVVGQLLELVPLCQDHDRMCPVHGGRGRVLELQAALVHCQVVVLELREGLLLLDLGVVDVDHGTVLHQHMANLQGRCFSHIASVFLEGEAQDCDFLVRHCVEEAGDDLGTEGGLLLLVHVHHLLPILGTSWQPLGFADINQIQNVLLEAGAAEADGGIQELGADPRVGTDGARDLCHICTCLLAEQRDGVDAADPLSQHSIRDQL
mmetsp:Transcript_71734/g.156139  ORF Transcript_71734/g.156139 Transcript_71734/m.156139 type:complete len:226 (+) Transcript_71734:432-1109(+)